MRGAHAGSQVELGLSRGGLRIRSSVFAPDPAAGGAHVLDIFARFLPAAETGFDHDAPIAIHFPVEADQVIPLVLVALPDLEG